MDDIVERLRDWVPAEAPPHGRTAPDAVADMREAAAEIEQLRSQLAARDGEIAEWLRGAAGQWFDDGGLYYEHAADAIERGDYRKGKEDV